MWKYKEQFIFPEIGFYEQDGELDFVQAIIEDNKNLARSRSLENFVDILNMRIGSDENFMYILEIYDILLKVDSMTKTKVNLLKLVFDSPEMIQTDNCETIQSFEISLNV